MMDLQREADDERAWTVKSEEEAVRLDRFKQGKLDRWGRSVSPATRMSDFYVERLEQDEQW